MMVRSQGEKHVTELEIGIHSQLTRTSNELGNGNEQHVSLVRRCRTDSESVIQFL